MDAKYSILQRFETERNVLAENGTLYLPIVEGQTVETVLFDRKELFFQLPVAERVNRGGLEYFSVDIGGSEKVGELVQQFMQSDSVCDIYKIFLADGFECHPLRFLGEVNFPMPILMRVQDGDRIVVVTVSYSSFGALNLLISDEEEMYRQNVHVELAGINVSGTVCSVSCIVDSIMMTHIPENTFVRMELRGVKSEFVQAFEVTTMVDEAGVATVNSKIDFDKIDRLFEDFWNVRIVARLWGGEYSFRVVNPKKHRKIANSVLRAALEHPYHREGVRAAAYFDLTKYGFLRLYTGAMNNLAECSEELGTTLQELVDNPEVNFGADVPVHVQEAGMGRLVLQLEEDAIGSQDEIACMVYSNPNVQIHLAQVEVLDAGLGIFEVRTSDFAEVCEGTGAQMVKMGIAVRRGGMFFKSRLYDKEAYSDYFISKYGFLDEDEDVQAGEDEDDDKRDLTVYMDSVCSVEVDGTKMEFCPYVNSQGSYRMRICSRQNMTVYKVVTEVEKIHVSSKSLKIRVKCPKGTKGWIGFALVYRYKKEEDKEERFFPADTVTETKDGSIVLSANISLEEQEFKGIYWSVRAVFEEGGDRYFAAVKAMDERIREQHKKLFQTNCKYYQVGQEKYILFPYVAGNGNINLMYRTSEGNDGFAFRFKERAGLRLYQVFGKWLRRKRIMLVYEKYCYMAEDNGYQLFRYCMENNMEEYMGRKIYYVIDKKAPDYQKVKQYRGHVLKFMSIRFIAYMLASNLLVSSDVRSHAYAWRHRSSIIDHVILKKNHVFLQHGVTAMKQVHGIFGKSKGMPTNLFVVTSDEEYEIVSKYFGYTKNEIALTGFARWDVLDDKSEGRRDILVMPTWRNWLDDVDSETFKESDYYRNYMELLNSKRLSAILQDNDVHMNFYIHPKFKDYMENFNINGERVRLIPFGAEPLNELMMQCNMLITDYSSVSWDVYYMKKPVLFYQFDIDMYNQTHGSYMDMEHDLFGDRTLEREELIDLIEENIKNGFVLKEKYAQERKRHFKYIDKNNCKRICNMIREKGL